MKFSQISAELALAVLMLNAKAAVAQQWRLAATNANEHLYARVIELNQIGSRETQLSLPATVVQTTVSPSIEQLLQQGRAAQEAGNYAEAETIWRRIIKLDPNNASVYNNLGIVLAQRGQWEEAIASFSHAVELNPNFAWAHSNLGNALGEVGQLEAAIDATRRAIELAPNNAHFYDNLGVALAENGQWQEAIAAYRRAIELNPNLTNAYRNLGTALAQKGQWQEAIAAYRHAINIPDDAQAYYLLGMILHNQEQLEGATASFRRTIELNPNHARAYTSLGAVLAEQGQLAEAVSLHRQALKLDPQLAGAYTNLGIALYQQGQVEAALENFHRSLELAPQELRFLEDLEPYRYLSIALRQIGEFEESIKIIRQAIEINPYTANGVSCDLVFEAVNSLDIPVELIVRQYKSAFCELRLMAQSPELLEEKIAEARETMRRAINRYPNYAQAHKKLGFEEALMIEMHHLPELTNPSRKLTPARAVAHFNLGLALLNRAMLTGESEAMKEAIVSFQQTVDLDPTYAWTYVFLGMGLTTQNRLDEVIEAARQALQLPEIQKVEGAPASAHTLAHNLLGYALQLQGNLKTAIEEYKQAIQLDPNFLMARQNLEEARRLFQSP